MDDPKPSPQFEQFERVVIEYNPSVSESERPIECCRRSVAGLQGTVVWRDSYCIHRPDPDFRKWLYVVYLPTKNCYATFAEPDLVSTGVHDSPQDHFGKCFEISYDLVMDDDMEFVDGCYRSPGRFWAVFLFRKREVSRIEVHHSQANSGIDELSFDVPAEIKLNREYVQQMLSEAVGGSEWVEVRGPDSMLLR